MKFHYRNLGLMSLAIWSLTISSARAQLVTNFESPPYNASATGTLLTGQQGWYVPVAGSPDYNAFTYAGNSLGLPVNSTGGAQFVGGVSGGTVFARSQHDVDFSTSPIWTFSYDVAHGFNGTLPSAQNLGSFSMANTATTSFRQLIALHTWVDPTTATSWNAGYNTYDAAGTAQPTLSPGAAWNNLLLNNWYRESFTVDFTSNLVLSVSLRDLTGGGGTNTFIPTGWYMLGGATGSTLPLPTSVRFFAGGGAGDIAGWDNLSVTPVPEPTSIALVGVGLFGVTVRRYRKRRE
jgi:hypothetical protein